MKIFQKKRAGSQPLTKIEKRIQSFPTHDLTIWAETLLPSIGKAVVHHQRDDVESLIDAETDAETLLAIVKELKKRKNEF